MSLITRRTFLGTAAALAAHADSPALHPEKLAQFVDPLPLLSVAKSTGLRPVPRQPNLIAPYFRLAMSQIHSKVHRDLPATRMWGFGGSSPGPTIETRSGAGVIVEWVNNLPATHLLPVDHNLMGAEADKPDVRTVVHLHGAKTLYGFHIAGRQRRSGEKQGHQPAQS